MSDWERFRWQIGRLRWGFATWFCFIIGPLWVLLVLLQQGTRTTFGDIYPGLSLTAAGLVYRLATPFLFGDTPPADPEKPEAPPPSDMEP